MDSTRWDRFRFRHDDIVVVSWGKAGTTWVQQMVGELIFKGSPPVPVLQLSPWLEHRMQSQEFVHAILEAQRHRRFIKSHLSAPALPYSPSAKYIYVGREGKDVIWSWYQHHKRISPEALELLNSALDHTCVPLPRPAPTFSECFHAWLDRDGFPLWPFWSHVQSWWELRDRPNVHLVHFRALKRDLSRETRRIAAFLDVELSEDELTRVVSHCSFEHMKRYTPELPPLAGSHLADGIGALINKGVNDGWLGALDETELRKYDSFAMKRLTPPCAAWLEGYVASSRRDSG
jgi:aryl sulfotransferase